MFADMPQAGMVSCVIPRFSQVLSLIFGVLIASVGLYGEEARAQSASGYADYLAELRVQARAQGVSEATIGSVFPTLSYLDFVIRLDRSQPGSADPGARIPDFEPYRRIHVTQPRINAGRAKLAALRPMLQRIEAQTGVPASFLIAIYGKESNYGAYMGNTDVPSALATLAYEGRRRNLFAGEFVAALRMVDRGVPRHSLKGSWAGAMGKPQFMPSVYLSMARDGDGDGRADIWHNEADAMASIAHYLQQAGWRAGQPWGLAVTVPAALDRAAIANKTVAPRCPRVFERHSRWKTLAEWRALGIMPRRGFWTGDDSVMATLLEPDGPGRTAYLLTGNYRVILDYNCSNFYALSVGLLADEIGS